MNAWTRFLQADWFEQVGWTLLHSLWQVTLVAAAYAIAAFLFRKRSANVRYVAGCTALCGAVCLPVATYLLHSHSTLSGIGRESGSRPVAEMKVEAAFPSGQRAHESTAAAVAPFPDSPSDTIRNVAVDAPDTAVPATRDEPRFAAALRPWLPWATAVWLAGVFLLSLLARIRRLAGKPHSELRSLRTLSPGERGYAPIHGIPSWKCRTSNVAPVRHHC
jgi:hypothetical protein